MKISDVRDLALRLFGNICTTRAVVAVGATTTAITSTNAVVYAIDGILRNLAAFTNQALVALSASDLPANLANYLQPSTLAGFYVQPANTTVYYVLVATSAGNVRVVQGTYAGQVITNTFGYTIVGDGTVPDVPDNCTPFGLMKIASGGSAFTPGTTALTGLVTFFDVMALGATAKP
jgi:hypothetical protein